MKKLLLTIILSIFFMTGVNAQNSVVDNPSNRAYFGLRAGLDIACPGKIKSGGVGIGLFESGWIQYRRDLQHTRCSQLLHRAGTEPLL